MSTTPTSPSEDDLKAALVALKEANPALGIPKLHALVLAEHPTWSVSEKRVKRILQSAGLVLAPPSSKSPALDAPHPSSQLIPHLDVTKWSSKVAVKYFNKTKGKGLVATAPIAEGEVLWKEDPFVVAAEWEIFDLQQAACACAFCTTPLTDSPLVVRCAAGGACPARFCTRLCLARSAREHPLLCAATNPAAGPLLAFARRSEWMALHAAARVAARLLLAAQSTDSAQFEEDWAFVRALAVLGLEERAKGAWFHGEPDRAAWKKAHALFVQAFQTPSSPAHARKLARILKTPLDPAVAAELFSYDGFLRTLGRMSLNLEAHGGLYTLHSHLNHDCAPTVSVRHLDTRTALARITVLARAPLAPGDELTIAYVDPAQGVRARRDALGGWGFGVCRCARCVAEEREAPVPAPEQEGLADLERELKAGLGVM